MLKLSSKPIIKKLIREFRDKFNISQESKNKFYFGETYYSPDLVLKNKRNDKVVAMIEIEQGTRKHVIGGVITADYVCGLKSLKPVFIILGLTPQDVKDYKKRKPLIISYVKNLKLVVIGDFKEVVKELEKL